MRKRDQIVKKICEQCNQKFEGKLYTRFCSKSCATTHRNLLPENRLRSASICKERNQSVEMRKASSINMKTLRGNWSSDESILNKCKESRRENMIKINKLQGMNKPKESEEYAANLLRDLGVFYEREKRIELSSTRDKSGRFSGTYYRLDFYIPSMNLDLEIDGSIHEQKKQIEHDNLRDAILRDRGIKIIRIKFRGDYNSLREDIIKNLSEAGVV